MDPDVAYWWKKQSGKLLVEDVNSWLSLSSWVTLNEHDWWEGDVPVIRLDDDLTPEQMAERIIHNAYNNYTFDSHFHQGSRPGFGDLMKLGRAEIDPELFIQFRKNHFNAEAPVIKMLAEGYFKGIASFSVAGDVLVVAAEVSEDGFKAHHILSALPFIPSGLSKLSRFEIKIPGSGKLNVSSKAADNLQFASYNELRAFGELPTWKQQNILNSLSHASNEKAARRIIDTQLATKAMPDLPKDELRMYHLWESELRRGVREAPTSSVLRKEANVTLNRPLSGMGSGVHPNLLIRNGEKTQGIFSHGGTDIPLQSGVKGPGEHLTSNLPDLGFNARQAAQHVEGHAAAIMRKHGITDADVFINYVGGPCGPNCQRTLHELLPSGAKLRVHFPKPDGSIGIWEFTGGVPKHTVIQ